MFGPMGIAAALPHWPHLGFAFYPRTRAPYVTDLTITETLIAGCDQRPRDYQRRTLPGRLARIGCISIRQAGSTDIIRNRSISRQKLPLLAISPALD